MRIDRFSFGSIRIEGETYDRDVVIDRGEVRLRKKKPSKQFRDRFGHTPLSTAEKIPWECDRLVIGTGAQGSLPVMTEVVAEAKRRGVELTAVRTEKAIELLQSAGRGTNAVLHITC
ncbi:MAG TPA: MTH938/NDUFAF3 family protein [Candidatus Dormibacteraeota bacterium]|nr:MTH938/NDUFAF3 family protein [Candidatus Dormibacteraeota bacterium]